MKPTAPSLPAHYPTLDGLRGIACLLVVTHNLLLIHAPVGLASYLFVAVLDRGWIGVQLFFVLSGFLITGILLDTRGTPHYLRHFFMRRVLRIFPLYYATLALLLIVLPALDWLPPTFKRDPPNEIYLWTYLWNWVHPFHIGKSSFPHFWSLCIEEQFYLLWPFLLLGRTPRGTMRLCGGVVALGIASRIALLLGGAPVDAVYEFTICRIDALAMGGMAAAALRDPQWAERALQQRARLALAAMAVLIVGALLTRGYPIFGVANQTIGYSALAAASTLLVIAAAAADATRDASGWPGVLRHSALRSVGRYSYAMYVLHVPLHLLVGVPLLARLGHADTRDPLVALIYIVVGTLVSYGVAALSYHAFEVHFLRMKGHLGRTAVATHSANPPTR